MPQTSTFTNVSPPLKSAARTASNADDEMLSAIESLRSEVGEISTEMARLPRLGLAVFFFLAAALVGAFKMFGAHFSSMFD